MYRRSLGLSLVLVLALAGPAMAAETAEYFDGKTVTYVVATSPGGGYDAYGRLIARYMEKHLPGSTIIVRNIPGAGHIIGTNMIYKSKPNGLTIGTFNIGIVYSQLVGGKGVRFDLRKMSFLGKAASSSRVLITSVNSGIDSIAGLRDPKRAVKFAMGGVGSAAYTELQLLRFTFGFNLKLLFGYNTNTVTLAMMRNEVEGRLSDYESYLQFIQTGKGKFILRFSDGGKVPDILKNVPSAMTYAKTPAAKAVVNLIASQGALARVTAGPPGIKPGRLKVLRAAYRKALTDPRLLSDAKKMRRSIDPLFGDDVLKLIHQSLNQPPEVVALLDRVANVKPDTITFNSPILKIKRKGRVLTLRDKSGKEVTTRISGSRTKVYIAGKKTRRSKLKVGMKCKISYYGPGKEATSVACK